MRKPRYPEIRNPSKVILWMVIFLSPKSMINDKQPHWKNMEINQPVFISRLANSWRIWGQVTETIKDSYFIEYKHLLWLLRLVAPKTLPLYPQGENLDHWLTVREDELSGAEEVERKVKVSKSTSTWKLKLFPLRFNKSI